MSGLARRFVEQQQYEQPARRLPLQQQSEEQEQQYRISLFPVRSVFSNHS